MRVNEAVLRGVILDAFSGHTKYMMSAFADWLELRIAGLTECAKDVTFWNYLIQIQLCYKYRVRVNHG